MDTNERELVAPYFVSIRVPSWFWLQLDPQNQLRIDTKWRDFSRGLLRVHLRAFVVPIPARPAEPTTNRHQMTRF